MKIVAATFCVACDDEAVEHKPDRLGSSRASFHYTTYKLWLGRVEGRIGKVVDKISVDHCAIGLSGAPPSEVDAALREESASNNNLEPISLFQRMSLGHGVCDADHLRCRLARDQAE